MTIPLLIVRIPHEGPDPSGFLGTGIASCERPAMFRDLPNNASEVPEAIKGKGLGSMAVDVENDFQAYYVSRRTAGVPSVT